MLARLLPLTLVLPLSACSTAEPETSVTPSAATHTATPEGMSAEEMAELEKKMAESAAPGPEHEVLAKLAGDWTMKTVITMGPEPMETSAEVHSEMILGGRFLLQTAKGGEGPMAMESTTIMGFDRRHGVFTIYGCDTMGTYCIGGKGPWDAETNSMTLYGEDEDPIAKLTQKYDIVIKLNDDGSWQSQVVFKAGTFGNAEDLVAVTNTLTKR